MASNVSFKVRLGWTCGFCFSVFRPKISSHRIPHVIFEAQCNTEYCSYPDSDVDERLHSVPIHQDILVLKQDTQDGKCFSATFERVAVGCTCVWAKTSWNDSVCFNVLLKLCIWCNKMLFWQVHLTQMLYWRSYWITLIFIFIYLATSSSFTEPVDNVTIKCFFLIYSLQFA